MRIATHFSHFFLTVLLAACAAEVFAGPPPAIEMTSLLEAFKLQHHSGRLDLNARTGANGAFIPVNSKVQVAITKKGQRKPLVSLPVRVRPLGKVWSNIQVNGATHYQFTEGGDYTITYFVNGKPATSFDFSVTVQGGDDPFAPGSNYFVNGPWNDLAFLHLVNGKPTTPLTFKFFTRQETAKPDNNMKATVELFHDGELIAQANPGGVAWSEWSLKEFSFSFPVEQGGRKFTFGDLVKNDGDYTITVKMDGELYGRYPVKVSGGKVAQHERQSMKHSPSSEWLVPRRNAGLDSADPIYYLTRTKTAAKSTSTAQAPRVSESRRDGWEIIPDADPERPFQLVHTNIPTRRDTPIAAGDGIVAFATGSRGVAYFRVGEDEQQSIPNGQQYRGDLFHACGKLIVLANRNNLFVHDTVSGRTEAIEDSDVHMRYQKGALYGPRLVDADGYLVVTVNEPTKVRDRAVIKVLDLSGDEPQVISLRGSVAVDDVSSVAVNAKHGYVAVGSKRKQAIFVAKVAAGAKFHKFDISGYDSFGEMDMALLDRYVVYQDAAGFPSIRALDLDNNKVVTPDFGKHGGSWGTTVATNGRVVTWPTRDPRATFVLSDLKTTAPLANSGEKVSTTSYSGSFGQGNSAFVAHEGTVFLAGSQSISEKKCLQMAMDDRWVAVTGADGKPIPAIDVVGGEAMVAFKTGKRSTSGPVTISYITYGERINYTPASNVATESAQTAAVAAPSPSRETKPASVGPQIDVAKEAYLATMLDSEKQIYEALKPTFGEEKARKQAVDTALRALKASGHEDWIADYKERSELAD